MLVNLPTHIQLCVLKVQTDLQQQQPTKNPPTKTNRQKKKNPQNNPVSSSHLERTWPIKVMLGTLHTGEHTGAFSTSWHD